MKRKWMYLEDRSCKEYADGVKLFIEMAAHSVGERMDLSRFSVGGDRRVIRCPCQECKNAQIHNINFVESHLYRYGFTRNYKRWVYHGEEINPTGKTFQNDSSEGDDDEDGDEQLSNDAPVPILSNNILEHLISDGSKSTCGGFDSDFVRLFNQDCFPLYPECNKMSGLEFVAKLMHLKVLNHWSNKSLDMFLRLQTAASPKGSSLPASHHDAKKLMNDLGFGYELIHACKYDCALFWKEHASCDRCPICREPRYKYENSKGEKIPQKAMYYFPLKPRLQRLFMLKTTATDMRWHKEKRVNVKGELKHPADSEEWRNFDEQYPWFAQDARNVRLGLATKGFNPFGEKSDKYSMWPVTLVPYNLPPTKCMTEAGFMLTLLIPGPQSPGRDIDVYLRPLIDELKDLWNNGVQTHDVSSGDTFQLHACLLWTISDIITYESLSCWNLKGYSACPICEFETSTLSLTSKKWSLQNRKYYLGHRRYLPPNHSWRDHEQYSKDWSGEHRLPPEEKSGEEILREFDTVRTVKPGKNPNNSDRKRARNNIFRNWIKRSIFFDLDYWSTLKVRHNLDVMYVEKNLCDSILGTLLNIAKKTKDTNRDRAELEILDIRRELHLQHCGNKLLKPPACYTLQVDQRRDFVRFLKYVRLPDAYAIDLSKKISLTQGKVSELEAHECHVILQRLLPLAVHMALRKDITTTLTELSTFFQLLCAKTVRVKGLDKLQERIAFVLCKLEKIYPPSFFDIIVHLAVHLPHEAKLLGPVGFRWMYPFERNLEKMRKYVRKEARPEESIAEAYIANEALRFCAAYVTDRKTHLNQGESNDSTGHVKKTSSLSVFSQSVQLFGQQRSANFSSQELQKAHTYVLKRCNELEEYVDEHKNELRTISSVSIEERHEEEFSNWFSTRIKDLHQTEPTKVTDELLSLASGPDYRVNTYSGCIVDGVRFLTEEEDKNGTTQNCGVHCVEGHEGEDIDFYGVLYSVVELNYTFGYRVILFKCKWFDSNPRTQAVKTDCNIESIRLHSTWYEDFPYILPNEVQQAFYLIYPLWMTNMQKLNHNMFWDALWIRGNGEVDEENTSPVRSWSCNFKCVDHIGDIEGPNLLFEKGKAEVINTNVVPNIRGDFAGYQADLFDDPWYHYSSGSDENKWPRDADNDNDSDEYSDDENSDD